MPIPKPITHEELMADAPEGLYILPYTHVGPFYDITQHQQYDNVAQVLTARVLQKDRFPYTVEFSVRPDGRAVVLSWQIDPTVREAEIYKQEGA